MIFRRRIVALLFSLFLLASVPALAQNAGRANAPEQVKANLKSILNGGEFQSAQPVDSSIYEKAVKWLREMWDKLTEWFRHLFQFSDGGVSKSPGVQWVFIALFITIGTYVAYRLVRSYLANRKTKQAKSRTAFNLDETEEDISREPNDWLREAEQRRANGDFRRAYRAYFLAILLKLDQAGIAPFERGRTNGEYLRVLRRADRNDLRDLLAPLILEFDLRWYGNKPTMAVDAAEMQNQFDCFSEILAKESNKIDKSSTQAVSLTPEQA